MVTYISDFPRFQTSAQSSKYASSNCYAYLTDELPFHTTSFQSTNFTHLSVLLYHLPWFLYLRCSCIVIKRKYSCTVSMLTSLDLVLNNEHESLHIAGNRDVTKWRTLIYHLTPMTRQISNLVNEFLALNLKLLSSSIEKVRVLSMLG